MLLLVPRALADGEEHWPTLGPQVCDFIEGKCVHGPGDVLGRRVELTPEQRAIVYRLYELYPRGHDRAGRRRITRAGVSARRGWAKTEFGSWIATAELHPDAPVRFGGWDSRGEPVGIPVVSPLLLLFAASEEQADDTAFEAMSKCVTEGPLANELHVTGEYIGRLDGSGKAKTLAAAPSSAEGRLATWAWFEETHRAIRPAIKQAHKVVRDGFPKRIQGDPWSLETTTSFVPGEGSIAEATFTYAEKIAAGDLENPSLFFFHRQAGDEHDLTTREGRDAAIREATGPAAIAYTDVDRVNDQWDEDDADPLRLEQVWLNRPVQSALQAVNVLGWDLGAVAEPVIPEPGRIAVFGFDGSARRDTTGIVGCDLETGYQWLHAFWDPRELDSGEVPAADVRAAFDDAFSTWQVPLIYGDPSYFRETLDGLAGAYGHDVVVAWWPNMIRKSAFAIDQWLKTVDEGGIPHSGDERMRAQMANARRAPVEVRDPETGRKLCLLAKERQDSPKCKDLADASWMAWQARSDARRRGLDGAGTTTESWAY